MGKKSKEKRIEEERARLAERFSEADANQRAIVEKLIDQAAFMAVTLADLAARVNEEGVVDEYKNGREQFGFKQSATLQSYNALIKNYASVIKTLAQILPMAPRQKISFHFETPEKTPEEIEEENRREEEHQRKINAEIAEAVELQRQQREAWAEFVRNREKEKPMQSGVTFTAGSRRAL